MISYSLYLQLYLIASTNQSNNRNNLRTFSNFLNTAVKSQDCTHTQHQYTLTYNTTGTQPSRKNGKFASHVDWGVLPEIVNTYVNNRKYGCKKPAQIFKKFLYAYP